MSWRRGSPRRSGRPGVDQRDAVGAEEHRGVAAGAADLSGPRRNLLDLAERRLAPRVEARGRHPSPNERGEDGEPLYLRRASEVLVGRRRLAAAAWARATAAGTTGAGWQRLAR